MTEWIAFIACVRLLTAVLRVIRSMRMTSTEPALDFGAAVAVRARTARAEASGAFDADGAYLSVSDEPDGELGVSGRGRRKLLGCDQHAVGADHCRVMSVLVGVDATDDDWTCHCDLLLVFGS